MEELSLHILDIAQNSISALARLIRIVIDEDTAADRLLIEIQDDGCGMSEEMQREVVDPFVTTRSTRKVGLGIPMFKLGADSSGGSFSLKSKPGQGTTVTATYAISNIDRPPLGNIADTVVTLVICNPDSPEFEYVHRRDGREYFFSTAEVKRALAGVPINTPDVISWIQENIREGLQEINGGAL